MLEVLGFDYLPLHHYNNINNNNNNDDDDDLKNIYMRIVDLSNP